MRAEHERLCMPPRSFKQVQECNVFADTSNGT